MTPSSTALAERPTARRRAVSVSRALGSPTRAGIYTHLQEAEEALTVRDVAETFDLHPNVARTHLETLADAGLVGVGLRKHPGGGRPAKLYEARFLFEEHQDEESVRAVRGVLDEIARQTALARTAD